MKKTLIIIICIIGTVFIFVFASVIFSLSRFSSYKEQTANEKNQMVIDYFSGLYEEDIDDIEVTGCASLGSGSPVPFAGKNSNTTYEYKLRIGGKYSATVWVNWGSDSFSLKDSDYPGTPR